MTTKSISYFKKHLATMEITEPLIITRNGAPLYVVEPYASYKKRTEPFSFSRFFFIRPLPLLQKPQPQAQTVSSADILKSRLKMVIAEQSHLDGHRRNRAAQA